METNEIERRRWNDEQWASVWPKREAMTDAVTPFVLDAAALRAGERVLDVGCGGGRTSLAAAAAVGPEGLVVGADVSEPITALAVARGREAGAENVVFHVVDMQVEHVDGGPFDVALSQFGVMFFDEPVTAFANIRAHLAPGGRLAFACWQAMDRNPWFFAPAIAGLLPPPPAPAPGKSPTGPFALADPEQTTAILEQAGFVGVRRTPHQIDADVPQEAVVDDGQLVFMGVGPDAFEEARTTVHDYMAQFAAGPGRSLLPLAFQVFEAKNP